MDVDALSLKTLVRPPKEPQAAPVLVLLHGVGSNEEDLFGLAPAIDDRFWVLAARAPLVLGPGQFAWYHIQFAGQDFVADSAAIESARLAILEYLDEVKLAIGAPANRIVLGGFSQGAIMSELVALTTPQNVGGLVAMSGRTLREALERLAPRPDLEGFRAIVTHGVHDEVIPIRHARETHEILESLGIDLTYTEYPTSHGIGEENLDQVATWLTAWADRVVANAP